MIMLVITISVRYKIMGHPICPAYIFEMITMHRAHHRWDVLTFEGGGENTILDCLEPEKQLSVFGQA